MLTVTADADFAILTGTIGGISTLRAQGVEKLVFVTKSAKSTFSLANLLGKGSHSEGYKLTHDGLFLAYLLFVNSITYCSAPEGLKTGYRITDR